MLSKKKGGVYEWLKQQTVRKKYLYIRIKKMMELKLILIIAQLRKQVQVRKQVSN